MSALCREFGISRKTGYKWAGRYFELGAAGLADGSRRPHSSPTAIDPDLAGALVGARKRYPFFGPRKLRAFLVKHNPQIEMPAASTIGEILRRHGLLRPRKRRRVAPPATQPSSSPRSASSACPTRCGATTARPSPRPRSVDSPACRSGGSGSGSASSASSRATPSRTGGTSACTGPSNKRLHRRPRSISRASSAPSTASVIDTTTSGRTKPSARSHPRASTLRRHGPSRASSPSSSTPTDTSYVEFSATARTGGEVSPCFSPTVSKTRQSAFKKSISIDGTSTSEPSCSASSTTEVHSRN